MNWLFAAKSSKVTNSLNFSHKNEGNGTFVFGDGSVTDTVRSIHARDFKTAKYGHECIE